jgi:hypothetical protein
MLDEQDGRLLCACSACALLFEREAAGGRHYRLVPTGRVRLDGLSAEPLGVPVGLAFFIIGDKGQVLAHYPSPLGVTQSELDPNEWRAVVGQSPELAAMKPRLQAFLVRTSTVPGRDLHWILPVDDCYRLVAVIRRHWTGMAGGSVVWQEIARFFDELERDGGRIPGPGGQ